MARAPRPLPPKSNRCAQLLFLCTVTRTIINKPSLRISPPPPRTPMSYSPSPQKIIAQPSPVLHATVHSVRPLTYATALPAEDLPAYVRGASAIRRWGKFFAIIQDDIHAIALLDPATNELSSILLPRAEDGRRTFGDDTGNKALKMDLESAVVLQDGRLLAFGSGSAPQRERIAVINTDHTSHIVDATDLYAQFHARTDFSGSELNIEGALVIDQTLRFFQRGNGAPRAGLLPINAFADFDLPTFVAWLDNAGPLPTLGPATQVDLGTTAGVHFDFTDATLLPDNRIAFLAGAEDSPDAYQDGIILGTRLGIIDGNQIHYTDILDSNGKTSLLKLEGIEYLPSPTNPNTLEFIVTADMDDTTIPSPIAILTVQTTQDLL